VGGDGKNYNLTLAKAVVPEDPVGDTYGHLVPGGNKRALDRIVTIVEEAKPQEPGSTGHSLVIAQSDKGLDYL